MWAAVRRTRGSDPSHDHHAPQEPRSQAKDELECEGRRATVRETSQRMWRAYPTDQSGGRAEEKQRVGY